MKTVNIPRTVTDPKYRYTMPLLSQKIEGKGINIRTNLTNLKDVAKSLRVPAEYILKFMGYEFGSQVNLKDNTTSINGDQNENDVLKMLDKFIEKFILCPKCHFPEMVLNVEEKELTGKCNSCGTTSQLDRKHKLTTYIIKNPPENRSEMKNIKPSLVSFDSTSKSKQDLEAKKLELRKMIRESSFSPFIEADLPVFAVVKEYLSLVLPITDEYFFDDGHAELVYKAIKRLRLNKLNYDRVGYILFSYIFDSGILKQIDSRSILFEEVLKRHRMQDFISHEIILNCQVLFYHQDVAGEWAKKIPTVLKKFYDQELLSEV